MEQDRALDVLLVGYENQENLGLRSIMAYLLAQGYRAALAPFTPGRHEEILALAQQNRPRVIGFSLIFQYTVEEFGALMRHLREHGVAAHFTAGGHFPSLRPTETLQLLPELDSVVRFEGEETLVELLGSLERADALGAIQGLAFRQGEEVILTSPRPLITDLDSLPPIYRDEPRYAAGGIPMASMLASRGCLFNCSFCSIRQFYGSVEGPLRRIRSPQNVVAEMGALYRERGARLFIFQDDDFAARTPRQREWLDAFMAALRQEGLKTVVRWKISCRVDDLEDGLLQRMAEHGLMAVYLGVESGNEAGLRALNKHVSVAQNLAAIDLLKRHDLALAIGFMIFDPSSTPSTVRENIAFLREVGSDGYFPVNFCKMLPYAGTPIEADLRAAGRLKGSITRPDYSLLDPELDGYVYLVQRIFTRRNFGGDGLVQRLQQADFEARLARTLDLEAPPAAYFAKLREIVAYTNTLALDTLEALLDALTARGLDALLSEQEALLTLAEREWRGENEAELALAALSERAVSA